MWEKQHEENVKITKTDNKWYFKNPSLSKIINAIPPSHTPPPHPTAMTDMAVTVALQAALVLNNIHQFYIECQIPGQILSEDKDSDGETVFLPDIFILLVLLFHLTFTFYFLTLHSIKATDSSFHPSKTFFVLLFLQTQKSIVRHS